MGYYCKIVHEDLSDYMVATVPVGNMVELYPRSSKSSKKSSMEELTALMERKLMIRSTKSDQQ